MAAKTSLCLGILLALGAAAAPALAQDAPGFGETWIENVSYAGTGCPAGSAAWNLSPDNKAISFLFSQFSVDSSTNRGREVKKSCWLNLQLHVPAGWTYTLFSVDYRGYLDLDRDSNARLRSWYGMNGQQIRIANDKIDGPVSRDVQRRAWVPLDTLPWLQCGTSSSIVSINTELMVDGPRALFTVDSIDGEIHQQYGIAWRKCTNTTRWLGTCTAVLESQWGTDHSKYTATALGTSHPDAKGKAQAQAMAQCEAVRSQQRPLIRALMHCVTDDTICVATPQ